MVREYRDENHNLVGYEFSGADKIKFEVEFATFNSRIGVLESNSHDTKLKMDKIMDKQDLIIERQAALSEFVRTYMTENKVELAKIEGTPECPGINPRLQAVEGTLLTYKTTTRFYKWAIATLIAIIGIILKFKN